MVELDGRAVRVQAIGLQDRRPGEPVIVFEAGASNALEIWGGLLPRVASMAPVVAYDRAGLGRSEWDGTSPTPRHVADRLRRVLQQIGAGPPYVLVGFSWGGMLARYFAGYYPADVVGLVLVDPSPMVTESLADNLSPFEKIGAGRAGFEAYWSSFSALLRRRLRPYAPRMRYSEGCWKWIWRLETFALFLPCRWPWSLREVLRGAAHGPVRSPAALSSRPALSTSGSERMGPGVSSWHPGDGEQYDSYDSSRGSGSDRVGRATGARSLALNRFGK
jgi:pimeloyl-ACP methyl ester carboxylesterase